MKPPDYCYSLRARSAVVPYLLEFGSVSTPRRPYTQPVTVIGNISVNVTGP